MTEDHVVRLADYLPPAWTAESVSLDVSLRGARATVRSQVRYRRRAPADEPLLLDAPIAPAAVELDGVAVSLGTAWEGGKLRLAPSGDDCVVTCTVESVPAENRSLEGLYRSSGIFCTQCEAEGFRKITPFLDRPDVLAVYRTRIEADRVECPVLLANGNCVEQGDCGEGRHFAVWHDPFPKPSYLFALVAGDLGAVDGEFATRSGRRVALRVFVPHGKESRARHALDSVRHAMAHDELVWGREYDLDLFMIVAVDDFNFGAMENKGLNIFNSSLVLADPATATDQDYLRIESVVGHEYFHNWSGNRVTLRDWFQLSLKEGFTVLREQGFAATLRSAAVQRIDEVRFLRSAQFAEDAGALAHPVRPPTYQKIDNFYTATIYEKGAEVIRMMRTLVGGAAFRRGADLYFDRHDGTAATCEDFVRAIEEASGRNLEQFRRWYDQAGTPEVRATWTRTGDETLVLRLAQTTRATAECERKLPFVIPIAIGFLDASGRAVSVAMNDAAATSATQLIEFAEDTAEIRFDVPPGRIVPSLLRGFSAPINLIVDEPEEDLALRLAHDVDGFARFEAAQRLMLADLDRRIRGDTAREDADTLVLDALTGAFDDASLDGDLLAELLVPPDETFIGARYRPVCVDAIHSARAELRRAIGRRLRDRLIVRLETLDDAAAGQSAGAVAARRLELVCLGLLCAADPSLGMERALSIFRRARCLTEEIGALAVLADQDHPDADAALAAFERRWMDEPLVLDKWFALHARRDIDGRAAAVASLREHPRWTRDNPNRVRALIGVFAHTPQHFHAADGSGYRLVAEEVALIDARNPQLAARLAGVFSDWRRHEEARQDGMRSAMEALLRRSETSSNLSEVLSKSLA